MHKKIINTEENRVYDVGEVGEENILTMRMVDKALSGVDMLEYIRKYNPKDIATLKAALLEGSESSEIKELLANSVRGGKRIYNSIRRTGANFKTKTPLRVQAAQIMAYRIAFEKGVRIEGLSVAPSATLAPWAAAMLRGTNIKVIAQDFAVPSCPNLTGEMTGATLTLEQMNELGIEDSIVMHSELRLDARAHFLRSGYALKKARDLENDVVASKVKQLLESKKGIKLCVGEHHFERFVGGSFKDEQYLSKHLGGTEDLSAVQQLIKYQLDKAFSLVTTEQLVDHILAGRRIEIANEPIWAISGFGGSGAKDEQAEFVNKIITLWLIDRFGILACFCAVTYGGSVSPASATGLAAQANISGSLVGGASFDDIIKKLFETKLKDTSLDDFLIPARFLAQSEIYQVIKQEMEEKNLKVPSIFQIADQNNLTVGK